jgi:hypothetical protein
MLRKCGNALQHKKSGRPQGFREKQRLPDSRRIAKNRHQLLFIAVAILGGANLKGQLSAKE